MEDKDMNGIPEGQTPDLNDATPTPATQAEPPATEHEETPVDDSAPTEPTEPKPEGEEKQKKAEDLLQLTLNRQRRELQRLNRQTAEYRKRLQELEAGTTENLPPDSSTFDSVSEYEKALAQHYEAQADRKAQKLAEEKAEAARQAEMTAKQAERFAKSYNTWKAELPDYESKMETLESFIESLQIEDAKPQLDALSASLLDEDDPGAIGYYLASKPDLLAKMYTMTPREIQREVMRAGFEAKELAAPKPKTLPKPIAGVKGTATPQPSPLEMSQAEFRKKYLSFMA